MKFRIFIFASFMLFNLKAYATDKVTYYGVTMEYENSFYLGITSYGYEEKLLTQFETLIYGNNEETFFSEDDRYWTRTGCKPRDCDGNKGMLWLDRKDKVAIGVIAHPTWQDTNYDYSEESQILFFSNYFQDTSEFPNVFKKSYENWIKNKEIKPSFYRFLNSKNKIIEFKNLN